MSVQISKYVFVAATTLVTLVHETVAVVEDMTSRCDAFEYYDVTSGQCRHCDTICFDHDTRTARNAIDPTCQKLCPDYQLRPRALRQTFPEDKPVRLTLMEGGIFGFLIAFLIVSLIAALILRREVYKAFKTHCTAARAKGLLRPFFRDVDADDDINATSYIKLSDPFDEVEIIDRVTTV